jgi:hypothetical protein
MKKQDLLNAVYVSGSRVVEIAKLSGRQFIEIPSSLSAKRSTSPKDPFQTPRALKQDTSTPIIPNLRMKT